MTAELTKKIPKTANKETWKQIEGCPAYFVSDQGNIYSTLSNRLLRPVDRRGYKYVVLKGIDGKFNNYSVHRLVALAFLPNPNNLPEINHKDENKANNNLENLEWCTRKYNCNYGTGKERMAQGHDYDKIHEGQRKEVICVETGKVYRSVTEAALASGCHRESICRVCKGKQKTSGGFHWKYKAKEVG